MEALDHSAFWHSEHILNGPVRAPSSKTETVMNNRWGCLRFSITNAD
jgi:hypothetical protein